MSSADEIPDAVRARPWRPSDGPEPRVTTWPPGNQPALKVRSHGRWRRARVMARQDWADGRVFYQVSVDLRGDTTVTIRMYEWPQPGLRAVREPRQDDTAEQGGGLPRPTRKGRARTS